MSIIIAILIFSIIILFHELGHFLLAKANGIQVNEFCLGLGPTLFGIQKGETKYSIKLLPFGGACIMEGEDESSTNERAFNNKSVWARISVVFAGPFFNFIMAFVFAFILLLSVGCDLPKLYDVIPGYAADAAGIQGGDTIVSINGKKIHFYREISSFSTFYPGEAITVVVDRDGEKIETVLTPTLDEESGRYLYGFIGYGVREKISPIKCFVYSFHEVGYWIDTTVQSLRLLITGKVSPNDLSGPVGIVSTIGDTYQQSLETDGAYYAFLNLLNIAIFLSANLGVMNLLPLPALDGGRLVFLLVEAVRRKKIDPNKEGMVHFIGIALLMLLMVFVMMNDIRRLFIR
ncbi:MAG: RIP metalloprotease RseP [Agathobacter sp.]|nr:RIP metalloprotease RseP [Agathobacter sp.]MDY3889418.1 RIP metalloprotease RseP [Agathobacter sp.]